MLVKEIVLSDFQLKHFAQFVQKASQFQSEIKVRREDGEAANGKSILGLMSLNIHRKKITLEVKGADERNALTALVQMLEKKFN